MNHETYPPETVRAIIAEARRQGFDDRFIAEKLHLPPDDIEVIAGRVRASPVPGTPAAFIGEVCLWLEFFPAKHRRCLKENLTDAAALARSENLPDDKVMLRLLAVYVSIGEACTEPGSTARGCLRDFVMCMLGYLSQPEAPVIH